MSNKVIGRPIKFKESVRFSVATEQTIKDRLDYVADQQGLSRNSLINLILNDFFNSNKGK